ncbi:MAG: HEAT repeat domain-containing protein [Verrucomicrobia bacterium]|nr:HEAT repeat domain-containing protein [Verrucomicrobiota bacterium]
MTKAASDRLIERANQVGAGSTGISVADMARIPLTSDLIGEIEECLSSPDVAELKWGLWFANGILGSNPPQEFVKALLPRARAWLKHENWDVRDRALNIIIHLRENYRNYREVMLEMLQDPEPVVRWHALRECRTFLTRKDIPALLVFQNDKYMAETEMGSPLVYAIRNDALAAIETLCGKPFTKSEKVEPGEAGRMVYWWDWKPFLDWWSRRHSKWRFWERG